MSDAQKNSKSFAGLKVFHRGLILVLTPLLIEIALISALAFVLLESDKESLRETRYRRCAAIGAKLFWLANDSLIAGLCCYQGDPKVFIQLYDSSRKKLDEREKQLVELAGSDPLSAKAARQIVDCLNDLTPILDKAVQPIKEKKMLIELSGELQQIRQSFSSKKDVTLERLASVNKLQEKIAEASTARRVRLQNLQFQILSIGVAANLAAGFLLLLFYRAGISLRLKVVLSNTLKLAERLPLAGCLPGSDEIAQLDRAFHKMDSELKLAAQREKALFDNALDVICVLDHELKFLKVNPACQNLWGYKSGDLLGVSVIDIIVAEQKETARRLFENACRQDMLSDLEFSVAKVDGGMSENLWSSYYSEPEQSLYCVVHDISEAKQVEKLKQSFLKMMSSDLQQPLGKISEAIARLVGPLSAELSSKALARLATASKNLERLLALVNDLLQMTEMQSGTLELSMCSCKVSELAQRAAEDLEGLAQKSKIRFLIECGDNECYADPNRIVQVIVNLGSNAIKFSPPESAVVIRSRSSGPFVEVEVADCGRGVPAAFQKSIFEKFAQVDVADGRRKAGTGLGLPICRDIIEEHGGEIGVRSIEGSGSTFWVRLPASESAFRQRKAQLQEVKVESKTAGPDGEPAGFQASEFQNKGKQVIASQMPGRQSAQAASTDLAERGEPVSERRSFYTNMTLMQKGLVLIVFPLILEAFFVFGIYRVLIETEKSQLKDRHERQIAAAAYKLQEHYFKVSVLVVAGHSFENWSLYDQTWSAILSCARELRELVKNDVAAKSRFDAADKINSKMAAKIREGREIISEGFSRSNAEKAFMDRYEVWGGAISLSRRLGKLIDETEAREAINPVKQTELRRMQGGLLVLGLTGSALLSLVLARFFAMDITSRLALQADNAGRLARDLPLNPQIPGRDEIAGLDRSFHETAAKLSEARRKERAVFDNSKDLICILDQQGRFLRTNPAAVRLTGYNRSELEEKSLLQLLPAEEKNDSRLLQEDLSGGKSKELRLLHRDGRAVYLVLSLSKPQGQDYIYCVGHDISHRKELEQIKHDFLSVVSHDLRSPLTSLIGTATLIEEGACGPTGEGAARTVHDIIVQGGELIELVSDLLDLEKLEAGKMQLVSQTVCVADVLEKACAAAGIGAAQVEMEAEAGGRHVEIEADRQRLSQALASLLRHLAGADKDNKTVIRLALHKSACTVELIDENPVLPRDATAALFERNSAAGQKGCLRPGQSVLALPLAAGIIRAHGGSFDIVAGDGAQDIYRITLPSAHDNPVSPV
jgi:PAS domain S-box-containing protein